MSTPTNRGVAVRVEGLTKRFEKRGKVLEVLRDLDLDLGAGELAAVIGQSGSGKSTLLHLLGTLDHPSAGRVLFDGDEVFKRSGAALDALRNRRIGFIFLPVPPPAAGSGRLAQRDDPRLDRR